MVRGHWVRAGLLAVLVGTAVVVALAAGIPSVDEIRAEVDDAGPAGPVLFAVAFAGIALLPTPLAPLSIAAGVLFGLPVGFATVWVAAVVGAVAAFGIARALGRPAVVAISGERLARLDALLHRRGLAAMIGVRLVPVVPFTVFNYACGLTGISTRNYLLGTVFGIVPGTAAYVALGAFGGEPTSLPFVLAVVGLATLMLVGLTMARRNADRPVGVDEG